MSVVTDFSKLMEDLSKWQSDATIWFDIDNYVSYQQDFPSTGMVAPVSFPIEIPFKIKHPTTGKQIKIPMSVDFSNEKGYISINPDNKMSWEVSIDVSDEEIKYFLKYPFDNTRVNKDKYAIVIELSSTLDFNLMLGYLKMSIKSERSFQYSRPRFNRAFSEAESRPEKLDWMYENALDFIIKERGDDVLWADMLTLSKYDESKWFVDTGSAIINLLQGFSSSQKVYDCFNGYPETTFEIYNNISDYDQKLMFCQFLIGLNYLFPPEQLNDIPIFTQGGGHELMYGRSTQDSSKQFTITDRVKVGTKNERVIVNRYAVNQKTDIYKTIEQRQLSPLDWVMVVDSNVKRNSQNALQSLPVPALYAYYLAERKAHEELMKTLRISLDILAIVLAVGSLGTASGLSLAIAVIDIGVATTDLILMDEDVKKFLMQYEEGQWFVENWDIIYAMLGAGMLATSLVRGILQNGPQLLQRLKNLKNIGAKNQAFVKQLELFIAKIEASNVGKSLKPQLLEEVVIVSKPSNASTIKKILKLAFSSTDDFIEFVSKNLAGKGISVRKIEEKIFEVLYKGVVVESGNEQKVGAFLKKVYYKGPNKTTKFLNGLVNSLTKSRFLHSPTSGATLSGTEEMGTYLVGSFTSDLDFIIRELDYPEIIDMAVLEGNFAFNVPQGHKFNMLNVAKKVYDAAQESGGFFTRVNSKWVDYAVTQKVEVVIVSEQKYLRSWEQVDGLRKSVLTGFGKEIHRFEWKHGYRYDPKTMRMVPPNKAEGLKTLTKFEEYKILN